jgi:hypothetical protein
MVRIFLPITTNGDPFVKMQGILPEVNFIFSEAAGKMLRPD